MAGTYALSTTSVTKRPASWQPVSTMDCSNHFTPHYSNTANPKEEARLTCWRVITMITKKEANTQLLLSPSTQDTMSHFYQDHLISPEPFLSSYDPHVQAFPQGIPQGIPPGFPRMMSHQSTCEHQTKHRSNIIPQLDEPPIVRVRLGDHNKTTK